MKPVEQMTVDECQKELETLINYQLCGKSLAVQDFIRIGSLEDEIEFKLKNS